MTSKKKIVILTQFYAPEPFRFPVGIARDLKEKGHDVIVVTGFPNRPGGKLFPGYRQRFGFSEFIDEIPVYRSPLIVNHSLNPVARILNFLTFSATALTWSHKVRGADAVYVYATPATAAIPAQIWKAVFGIPYTLHVQDVWPESVTDSGMVGSSKLKDLVYRVLSSWTKRLYGNSDMLIAISAGMRDLLIERGSTPEKCSVVYNWADEEKIVPKPSESFEGNGVKLLYAGNLGPMQDLETMIDAAALMGNQPRFHLSLAGGGILEEQIKIKTRNLPQVDFLGRLSAEEVSELYLKSDFQLVTLKDLSVFRVTVPSKFQSSLAAGVPVITTVKGAVADLIEQYQAGLVAEPENPDSLRQVFQLALNMTAEERAEMGKNARRLYDELMSSASGLSSIASILSGEVRQSSGIGSPPLSINEKDK